MTKIEELEQKLNECQKALAELKESKKEGKWKPKQGDEIWFRNLNGVAGTFFYHEGIDTESTPIFPTEEACERYWHFMDAVKEKSYEFSKEEWEDDNIVKYYIQYDCYDECWEVDSSIFAKTLGVDYFKTCNDAQYIIDNFKEELMEYWL